MKCYPCTDQERYRMDTQYRWIDLRVRDIKVAY